MKVICKNNEIREGNFEEAWVKEAFWHTSAHVLAQAVKRLYPDTKCAIGPAIAQGFYYDFAVPQQVKIEDLIDADLLEAIDPKDFEKEYEIEYRSNEKILVVAYNLPNTDKISLLLTASLSFSPYLLDTIAVKAILMATINDIIKNIGCLVTVTAAFALLPILDT